MKLWPFNKTEKRDFTVSYVERMIAAANNPSLDAGQTAAAVIASGTIGRCFAAASVEPNLQSTGLNASVLDNIGRSFVLRGESVWYMDVLNGGLILYQAASWDIQGDGPDETTWTYKLELPGPTGNLQKSVPSGDVLHFRINVAASLPHRGVSPLAMAGYSAALLASAESSLADELGGPLGQLLPVPMDELGVKDDGSDPLDELEATLATLKGRSALVPSASRSWGEGTATSSSDWISRRLGADPPDSVVQLRGDAHAAILACAGVPPQLFSGGSSQAAREAFRFLLHSTISPIASMLELEASRKLGFPTRLDFTSLQAADIQGRARAFQSLVGGGMSLERAAGISGIIVSDD